MRGGGGGGGGGGVTRKRKGLRGPFTLYHFRFF